MIALAIFIAVIGRNVLEPALLLAAHAPHQLPLVLWAALAVCALLASAGALQLYVGITKAVGERDLILAGKALFWALVAMGLLWFGAYVPGWPLLNLCLKAGYIAWIPASLTRFFLALRGMPDTQLPDPEDLPDMPMSGPASPGEAEEGMGGRSGWRPPRFDE